jgi:thiamine-monophosphate kinase
MKLSDIGEEALIERIVKNNGLRASAPGLLIGIGDDAAVLGTDEQGMLALVTTDMLTENVDFRLDLITPYQLGWKSLAVNISDIAAMGGEPSWTFSSLGFRPDMEIEFIDEFYRGMAECAAHYGSTISGGDMNSVKGDCVISITQLGRVSPDHLALRSKARIGDQILVTGWLGNSRAGLELLLKYGFDEAARISAYLVEAHLMPLPRVPEARAAVATGAIHAMMDLSDGLGADLPKLCRASNVGALIYSDELPISADLNDAANMLGMNPFELSAGGGEDFELLMAVYPEDADMVKEAIESQTRSRVTRIGEIVEGDSIHVVSPDGGLKPLSRGWEHFV